MNDQHIESERSDVSGTRPPVRRLGRGFLDFMQSQIASRTMLHITYFNFFWVFVIGAFLGIVVETGFHMLLYGQFENRAGLVWGPFSPLYGVGAVVLTFTMNRLYKAHSLFIFALSALEGAIIEFFASLLLQYCWGAIAWDYTGTIGSIGGRTNLLFAFMWGLLGLFWVHIVMPIMAKTLTRFDSSHTLPKVITGLFTLFLVCDLTITWMALARQEARAASIPAHNAIEVTLDAYYPDAYMDSRFHNMSIMPNAEEVEPSEDSFAAQRRNQTKDA